VTDFMMASNCSWTTLCFLRTANFFRFLAHSCRSTSLTLPKMSKEVNKYYLGKWREIIIITEDWLFLLIWPSGGRRNCWADWQSCWRKFCGKKGIQSSQQHDTFPITVNNFKISKSNG
jgi:hypothetical protein